MVTATLRVSFTCLIAAAIRCWLMKSKYQIIIGNHIEVSTPLNSWKRVSEGLYLQSKNIDPYDGDLLHETPLSLLFYKHLKDIFHNNVLAIFILFDVFAGLLLYFTTRKYVKELKDKECKNIKNYAEDAKEYLFQEGDSVKAANYVLLAILFNPYSLLNCVGFSTTVFHNFFLSVFLFAMVYGHVLLGTAALAITASISLYPTVLIIPFCLYCLNKLNSLTKAVFSLLTFPIFLTIITLVCGKLADSFNYLSNVYGFILKVPDLQPNIGLFWYFFTEMFDHFRELFTYSFQINATILYLVPLSIKFRKQPFLLTVALIFLISIFKSYPCIGDVGFAMSLLPCFIYLFTFCQQGFLIGVVLLITTCLAPILWHLWIYCNSANANFYFGVTLAFAIAEIFLVTDILFAQVKREFCLVHGKNRKINGEEAEIGRAHV